MKQESRFIRHLILTVLFLSLFDSSAKVVFAGEKKQAAAKETPVALQGGVKSVVPVAGIPEPVATPNIAEIQQELQNIMQIHRALQVQHLNQVREIQRITEQAKVHQELLKNLAIPPPGLKKPPAVDIEETLRLQKIRLIQEQTKKNRALLESLQKKAGEREKEKPKPELGEEEGQKKETSAPSLVTSSGPSPGVKEKPKKTFW